MAFARLTGSAVILLASHGFPPTALACANARLSPGLYEVLVSLELPNVEVKAKKRVEICIGDDDGVASPGLTAFSDNNPLGACPVLNVAREGERLDFAIRCPGANKASASARYVIRGDAFTGRIKMDMGGKNMTMTEAQTGRRLAACPPTMAPLAAAAASPTAATDCAEAPEPRP